MKSSNFVFDYIQLLYYNCHKINPNRGGSYIYSPHWIKNNKAKINRINKEYNKCCQYSVKVALSYDKIKIDPQIIIQIKPFFK